MPIDVILVDLAALFTVAWIVWFFWLSEGRGTLAAVGEGGVQEAFVRVKGGYDPDLIVLEAGRPARLHFTRQETAACSERVLFPDLGISRSLPAGETVTVEIGPQPPGEYPFACQMGMLRGRLVMTDESPAR
ncbi:MAG: cupredoxin domain-containing protein [Gemmatimonadota bacterium]